MPKSIILAVALVALIASAAHAKWARTGEQVPVDRMIQNVTKRIADDPKDASLYYVLGRLHSYAYAIGDAGQVNISDKDGKVSFPHYEGVDYPRQVQKPKGDISHLLDSARNYQKATDLAPKEPLYWLGFGYVAELASTKSPDVDPALVKGEVANPSTKPADNLPKWQAMAIDAYRQAYKLRIDDDLKQKHAGPAANSVIAQEAAQGILRIDKDRTLSDDDKKEQAELTKSVAELNKAPRAITPIIFSVDRPAALPELLDDTTTVDFDLAGAGRGEKWPWVKPATAILCWDPDHTGQIRSGRQLFGSATFWMFFADGYQALSALDDNNDGVLAGRELDGLTVWQDRNSNGRSDAGEVQSAASAGIAKIAARATATRDGTKQNPAGVTLTTGQTLPTYDWTPTSRP